MPLQTLVVLLLVSTLHAQILLDTPPPASGKLVDIGGRKLHLNCTGSGSPAVIVENGSSSFSIDWTLVQPEVAKRTRICTYDRAGFAWSDRGPTLNTVEETVDDLHLLLRAASIRPPYVLVGASIGGMYVRAFQRRYPAEVAGLVLVDPTPEEDLEYMVNGKSTPGVKMTYDEMEAVYAPLLKDPPPPRELPAAIEAPYDRLPKDLQAARLWAARRLAARTDMPHAWITAESWRQEFFALRKHRLQKLHALDDLPLIVMARGKATNDVLRKREHDLVALSSVGKEIIATESDHEIFLYQPELVSKAIRDTVDAASHRRAR